jgi:N-acetylneuraminate synthase/N,N'-diacetyllegionaminate synthase
MSVLIIAEAGVNHNGSIDIAKSLVDAAIDAKADVVKFQTFSADRLVTLNAPKVAYQKDQNNINESQFTMLKKLELTREMHQELFDYCEKRNIKFLSTGFDFPSIDFLDALDPKLFKLPSGELTNKPYLQYIALKGKDIILSTGMANLQEVKDAVEVIEKEGIKRENITVLHCNTEYPTPMEDVNLLAMNQMAREVGVKVGYSDHTLGIEVPLAAVALGACVIEKHFTLDRTLPGPDHAASLEPDELKAMVTGIRNIEKAIGGSGIKEPSESEKKNIEIVRKSLHYKFDLKKGHVLGADDFSILRPASGISPMQIDSIIGKELKCDVIQGNTVRIDDLI